MNKSKFYITVIIALLCSNLVLFFLFIKDPKRHEGPKAIIREKLQFDDQQNNQYEKYIYKHRQSINQNELIMSELRSTLFAQLKNNQQDSSKIDSIISVIGQRQMIIEKINYTHFLEIKKICKPEQQQNFDAFTSEIVQLFTSKGRK
mgnify:CR=1 FL=1